MKPLQGLRIVSVEQFGAGPYATMLLADLGAEVIKVENATIGGDPSRKTGPFMLGPNDSEYFQAFNSNKKSVAIDLRAEDGKAALKALIGSADAVINNMRGDLPAKMGSTFSTRRPLHHRSNNRIDRGRRPALRHRAGKGDR